MASVRALTDLTVSDLWKEVKDEATLWGDISRERLRTVKLLLENRMHDELINHLNAGRYTRNPDRQGYRNGAYRRRLVTTWGTFPISIFPGPARAGSSPRCSPAINAAPVTSTRSSAASSSAASVPARSARPRQAARGRRQRHDRLHHHPGLGSGRRGLPPPAAGRSLSYLFLDAVSLRSQNRRAPTAAWFWWPTASGPPGSASSSTIRLVRYETQATWEAFLPTLACRGLTGQALRLITTDGHRGPPCRPGLHLSAPSPAKPAGSTSSATSRTGCASRIGRRVCGWPAGSTKPDRPRGEPPPAAVGPGLAGHRPRGGRLSDARGGCAARLLCRARGGLAPGAQHECD